MKVCIVENFSRIKTFKKPHILQGSGLVTRIHINYSYGEFTLLVNRNPHGSYNNNKFKKNINTINHVE